jgi:hypothetical protein
MTSVLHNSIAVITKFTSGFFSSLFLSIIHFPTDFTLNTEQEQAHQFYMTPSCCVCIWFSPEEQFYFPFGATAFGFH